MSYQRQPEHADLATLRDPSRLPAHTLADIGVGDIVRITTEGRVKEIYDDGSGLSLDTPGHGTIGVEQITSIAVITRAHRPLKVGDRVQNLMSGAFVIGQIKYIEDDWAWVCSGLHCQPFIIRIDAL